MSLRATRRLLRLKVQKYGGAEAVAQALGCTREYLYLLMSENSPKRPGIDMASAIETLLKVPMQAWVDKGRAA